MIERCGGEANLLRVSVLGVLGMMSQLGDQKWGHINSKIDICAFNGELASEVQMMSQDGREGIGEESKGREENH